jgi:hypothetical protein
MTKRSGDALRRTAEFQLCEECITLAEDRAIGVQNVIMSELRILGRK